jgi:hypothetical protein
VSDIERPTYEDIKALMASMVRMAESCDLPRESYRFHRRWAMGIDTTHEAARRAVLSHRGNLQRAAECAELWASAQEKREGSAERTALMEHANAILSDLNSP